MNMLLNEKDRKMKTQYCNIVSQIFINVSEMNEEFIDENKIDEGLFGINIHKAGQDSTWVENWSEGCQVFKRVKDFDAFLAICKKAAKIHGNKFSYTLLEPTDIV